MTRQITDVDLMHVHVDRVIEFVTEGRLEHNLDNDLSSYVRLSIIRNEKPIRSRSYNKLIDATFSVLSRHDKDCQQPYVP